MANRTLPEQRGHRYSTRTGFSHTQRFQVYPYIASPKRSSDSELLQTVFGRKSLLAPIAWTILFLCSLERLFQPDHVFARAHPGEWFGFAAQFIIGIVRGLDRQTYSAFCLVDLDAPGLDLLSNLEDILDFGDVFF